MQSGEMKKRFGRCPYCRAMVYKNPDATVFRCSKCQTPIRGKNSNTTDQADPSLSSTGDGDQPPLSNSFTSCSYLNANSQGVVAPAPSSPSSPYGGLFSSARPRRIHPLNHGAHRSARFYGGLVDSNEQGELRPLSRRARQPWSSDSSVLRHGVFMTTEPHLLAARALPFVESGAVGSSWPSIGNGGHRERRRKGHCRPVLGGAPFVVCGGCFELLQAPATTTAPSRSRGARLRCGGCGEVLELTVPTTVSISSSAHRTTRLRGAGAPNLPLHVALGYSSPDPLLQSRRH
ncbi:hypothetical protein EJB05_36156 [Eragrostis curvula]|uniref:Probable zinc-ribbon domain-containing protein n=1 Tax=Eragrostis curvula TaxID=38414 RepID=A0A5J9U9U9_9POAL|nr:hypothetical protein EJB05_36156 [Eragrostis curvula]